MEEEDHTVSRAKDQPGGQVQRMGERGPAPIPVRAPYFATRCEHCGWHGSSEQAGLSRNWDDADCVCPACERIFLCGEIEAPTALSHQQPHDQIREGEE